MNAIDQHNLGLYQKFTVTRTDGTDAPGEKHFGDEYFVLNISSDTNAIPALSAYADACEGTYPQLAIDLRAKISAKLSASNIFITIPEIILPSGTVVPTFRAAKYLASRGYGATPLSTEYGTPWVNISYHQARKACAESECSLLTESQALAIAFDISRQDINWSEGKVGDGHIYQGIHKGTLRNAQAATFESDDADERRWHQLSNGERIFDFAGNVFSWIFDDVQGDEIGLTGKIAEDSPSLTTAPYLSLQKGMGWRPNAGTDWSGNALIRGGYWLSGSSAGVFRLGCGWPEGENDDLGFRCTRPLGL